MAVLSAICRPASSITVGFDSQGRLCGYNAISGRRSQRITTRGASSEKRSRTMNSSVPRAEDSRADAFQSIVSTSSPGWYGRELATSEPIPRRTLLTAPKASPISLRRGTSGKVSSYCADIG